MSSEQDRSFFGHPCGLAMLFFTEMWEPWSFYGMRSILTLYLAGAATQGGLGFSEGNAKSLCHIYLALIANVLRHCSEVGFAQLHEHRAAVTT